MKFPSITSCCLCVLKLMIHEQMEVGTESQNCQFVQDRRISKGMVLKAVHKQDPLFAQTLHDVVQSYVDCIIHAPVCLIS